MKKKLLLLLPLVLTLGLGLASCKDKTPVEPDNHEEEVIPEPAKTTEEVVADINDIFAGLGIEDLLSWYEDYNCFIGGLNLGAAEATTDEEHVAELQSATEFVVSKLPEYLTTDAAGYEAEQDDYYIGLSVDSVGVDNFGYVNGSNNVIVQIQVATIEAESN